MIFHVCQSVRGALINWKKSDWKRATKFITKDDGSKLTESELKYLFLEELANGHEVIPIGECDNFDYKSGCRGHHKYTELERARKA